VLIQRITGRSGDGGHISPIITTAILSVSDSIECLFVMKFITHRRDSDDNRGIGRVIELLSFY
jgi:hypothetical protein